MQRAASHTSRADLAESRAVARLDGLAREIGAVFSFLNWWAATAGPSHALALGAPERASSSAPAVAASKTREGGNQKDPPMEILSGTAALLSLHEAGPNSIIERVDAITGHRSVPVTTRADLAESRAERGSRDWLGKSARSASS